MRPDLYPTYTLVKWLFNGIAGLVARMRKPRQRELTGCRRCLVINSKYQTEAARTSSTIATPQKVDTRSFPNPSFPYLLQYNVFDKSGSGLIAASLVEVMHLLIIQSEANRLCLSAFTLILLLGFYQGFASCHFFRITYKKVFDKQYRVSYM